MVHMLTKPQVFYDDTYKQALGYQNLFYLKKDQRIKPTLYDGNVISKKHDVIYVFDEEETLMLERRLQVNFQNVIHADFVPVVVLFANTKCLVNDNLENYIDEYSENLVLKAELAKKEEMVEKKYFDEVKSKLDAKDVSVAILRKHIESLKGKNVIEKDDTLNKAKVISPGMFKLDLEPSSPKVLKNMDAHMDYIKHTQENADILRELVKHARSLRPLDSDLDSPLICATCNECMFDAIHDSCGLDFVNDVNVHSKLKSSKSSKKKTTWKPTSNIFTTVGYKWIPTCQKLTIEGNMCPLTRITSTNVVPPKNLLLKKVAKKTTPRRNNPEMLKDVTNKSSSSRSKGVESNISNNSEHNKTWGSNVSIDSTSSLIDFRFGNDQISKIMGYNDYQMGNVIISRVYYVEALGHNLFSIGQFCDSDLEAEAVPTACYTQYRSLICKRHNKMPYELLHNRKPNLSHLYVFGTLCYPTNDSEDLGKLKPKADVGIFIGYAPKKNSGPKPQLLTPGTLSSGLVPNPPSLTPVDSLVPAFAALEPADSTSTPSSTINDQDTPSSSTSQTPQDTLLPIIPSGVEEEYHDIEVAHLDNDPFFGAPIPEPNSEESSSRDVILTNVHSVNQPPKHLRKWTKDHLLENVIRSPSRPVSTRH
ncbi:retrovirus-related pol polyprotein from transposon TNT 1-94 [Tanacetum coccineum]